MSQLKLSEMIDVSPNYLNAVENGKNFPSPEVIQHILDTLDIMPYQLFLELPTETRSHRSNTVISELIGIKQKFSKEIDTLIQKYEK